MTKRATTQWLRPTTRTERALQDAQEHAGRAGFGLVRPGHLLLALVQDPRGLSAQVLVRLGTSPTEVCEAMSRMSEETLASKDRREGPGEPTEFAWADNRAQMLDAARQEAQGLGDTYVGTEHLLLALLHGSGISSQALQGLGVTYEAALTALSEMKTEHLV